jgi:hypothetical protein
MIIVQMALPQPHETFLTAEGTSVNPERPNPKMSLLQGSLSNVRRCSDTVLVQQHRAPLPALWITAAKAISAGVIAGAHILFEVFERARLLFSQRSVNCQV